MTAVHAITVAEDARRGTEDQQLDLDAAEVALVVAVRTWRDAGRPD